MNGPEFVPIFGAESGYSTAGDVLVNTTSDGVNLNTIWAEVQQVAELYNNERAALAALLSYPTTLTADAIPQSLSSSTFEKASEFGVPVSNRVPTEALRLGYTFVDYDQASRFTWKFLRDSTSEQITAVFNNTLEADNKLVNTTILRRLFDPTPEENEYGATAYGLYTGTDGFTPPPYLGREFPTNTTHYIASGAPVIDSSDVESGIRAVASKGYGRQNGTRLLVLVNPAEGEAMSAWRAGEPSRPQISGETDFVLAKFDFIPSASAPAYLQPENIVGAVAPGEFGGLPVAGSYGPAWVVESEFVPSGYFAVVATSGASQPGNVIGFRQHANIAYRGLRIIPGNQQRYPLIDSYAARSFGVGVRHRGAAHVTQITSGSTYTPPTFNW